MARTAWVFDGYSWPTNPNDDSGWTTEPLLNERNTINSSRSTFHFTGLKSSRRECSGWLYGPEAVTQRNIMDNWLRSRTQANLTDHLGITRRAQLVRFEARPVQDTQAYKAGRATFQFQAEFIALD